MKGQAMLDEMLAAFLAIEPQDAHVKTWRAAKVAEQIPMVQASVEQRRRMAGATGTISTTETEPPMIDLNHRLDGRPLTTYAQFKADLDAGKPDAGVLRAAVNLTTLMGGAARFNLNEAQGRAASRFRSVYEQAQLGGGRAIDPSVEAVDGGNRNPEAVFEIGSDARRELIAVQRVLGPVDFRHAEYVIIGEHGPTAYARFRLRGERPNNGRLTSRFAVEFRSIMDRLAVHWRLQSRAA